MEGNRKFKKGIFCSDSHPIGTPNSGIHLLVDRYLNSSFRIPYLVINLCSCRVLIPAACAVFPIRPPCSLKSPWRYCVSMVSIPRRRTSFKGKAVPREICARASPGVRRSVGKPTGVSTEEASTIYARSMRFSSSRMLPGHEYRSKASRTWGWMS